MSAHRIVLSQEASSSWRKSRLPQDPWLEKQGYPAHWIHPPGPAREVAFTVFELTWRTTKKMRLDVHASADERYRLYYGGQPLGEGPERSHWHHWKFESYRLELKPGLHRLSALVWSLGAARPWAQAWIRHGFILWPEEIEHIQQIATGDAPWKCHRLSGVDLVAADPELQCNPGGGPGFLVDATKAKTKTWQLATRGNTARCTAERLYPGRHEHGLEPAELPAQKNELLPSAKVLCLIETPGKREWRKSFQVQDDRGDKLAWENLWAKGKVVQLKFNLTVEMVWDLGRYACGSPFVRLDALQSRGARLEFLVVEAPFDKPQGFLDKGRRDSIWGKYFRGVSDGFMPAPTTGTIQEFSPFWWRAGRFLVVRIFTGSKGLKLHGIGWKSTGYPLHLSIPEVSDGPLQKVLEVSAQTLQMCSHETYMDCPYYEQLMYAGDARIESLVTYCSSADARLPKKTLRLFDQSRANARGLPTDAVPGDHKMIPPFALWWISMIHDFACWHGNPGFIQTLLPGARQVADLFLQSIDADGLARQLGGWNFYDWCWPGGIPPGGNPGDASALLQWHLILVVGQIRELERWCGEAQRARNWQTKSERLCRATEQFWSHRRQMYADTPGGKTFAQHAQSLALLSGTLSRARRQALLRALQDPSAAVTKAGGYFAHYVFAALLQEKCVETFRAGLKPWHEALAQGFTTFPETFGATRSDCHAWNSHPLFHMVTGIAGLRPAQLGGKHWILDPCLGPLADLTVKIPRQEGAIEARFHRTGKLWRGELTLPSWAAVTFVRGRRTQNFKQGRHTIHFSD